MLKNCPTQITIPTISNGTTRTLRYLSSALSTPNSCSTSNTATELIVLSQFPASTKGNPPPIYEKGSTSGDYNDNQSAAKLVTPCIYEKGQLPKVATPSISSTKLN